MYLFIYRKDTSEAVKEYWKSILHSLAILVWCGGLANLCYRDNSTELNRIGDLVECFMLCCVMEMKRLGIKTKKKG